MPDWLLNLIPGGGITAAIGGIIVALGTLFGLFKTVQKTGYTKRLAEEAEARAKNIEDVSRAQRAGAAVRADDSLHDDPNNRDVKR